MKNDIVQSVPSANSLSGEMVKLLSYSQTLARRIKSAIKSSGYCQWVAVTWTRVSERASKRKYIWKLVGYLEFQKSSTLKIILCKEKVKNKSAYLEEILSPFLTVLNLFPFCLTFTDFFPALACFSPFPDTLPTQRIGTCHDFLPHIHIFWFLLFSSHGTINIFLLSPFLTSLFQSTTPSSQSSHNLDLYSFSFLFTFSSIHYH